jgi:hypothetical protein
MAADIMDIGGSFVAFFEFRTLFLGKMLIFQKTIAFCV